MSAALPQCADCWWWEQVDRDGTCHKLKRTTSAADGTSCEVFRWGGYCPKCGSCGCGGCCPYYCDECRVLHDSVGDEGMRDLGSDPIAARLGRASRGGEG